MRLPTFLTNWILSRSSHAAPSFLPLQPGLPSGNVTLPNYAAVR